MSDPWTERLSDYLDGELDAAELGELERHLRVCSDCADALEQLRAVVARAATLTDRAPESDLWPAIEARLGRHEASGTPAPGAPRGRISLSVAQLAAASIGLILLSGATAWWLARGASQPARPDAPAATIQPAAARQADPQYDAAIADLERALLEGRELLQPETLRILEQNLATIDRAIGEAQRALAADPSNLYLNNHLADTRRRKLALLRQAAAIVRESNWRA